MPSLPVLLTSLSVVTAVVAIATQLWPRVGRAPQGVSFSEDARTIVDRAEQEAAIRGAAPISPEHILLALVADRSSPVATILHRRGVDVDALREELSASLPTGSPGPEQIRPPYTARAASVLVHALREAAANQSAHAGPVQLLAGVLRAGRSRARHLLRTSGVTLESIRSARALGA